MSCITIWPNNFRFVLHFASFSEFFFSINFILKFHNILWLLSVTFLLPFSFATPVPHPPIIHRSCRTIKFWNRSGRRFWILSHWIRQSPALLYAESEEIILYSNDKMCGKTFFVDLEEHNKASYLRAIL